MLLKLSKELIICKLSFIYIQMQHMITCAISVSSMFLIEPLTVALILLCEALQCIFVEMSLVLFNKKIQLRLDLHQDSNPVEIRQDTKYHCFIIVPWKILSHYKAQKLETLLEQDQHQGHSLLANICGAWETHASCHL